MSKVIFQNDWQGLLGDEFEQSYYQELRRFLIDEYRNRVIFPDMHDIFNALHLTAYSDVKVVILGQDPYHGRGQAHGLSFSVKRGVKSPPSLVNIFKELESDLGCKPVNHGCLESWAREGVLLLNAVLTVREGEANSHRGRGWEKFTDRVIELVNEKRERVVFILWGRQAREKKSLIDLSRHSVIESVHPSPLSVHGGFFGSKPFSRANAYLEESGRQGVHWGLEEFV